MTFPLIMLPLIKGSTLTSHHSILLATPLTTLSISLPKQIVVPKFRSDSAFLALLNSTPLFKLLSFSHKRIKHQIRFMNMKNDAPDVVLKDIVLIGGGHSHVIVLKNFAMSPMRGVRLTLITRDLHTPYSGMLPGLIAGHYTFDDCHIDLRPLCEFCNARLIHCSVNGIDTKEKKVLLEGRPPIPYDILSIDIGITPSKNVIGCDKFCIPVKPIDLFNERWEKIKKNIINSNKKMKICVVGGGAGGVELIFAIHFCLQKEFKARGLSFDHLSFFLFSKNKILSSHSVKVGEICKRIFKEKGIHFVEDREVLEIKEDAIILNNNNNENNNDSSNDDDKTYEYDYCFWCTQGSAAPWLQSTGLKLDENGFILVNPFLESTNTPLVFASGDIHSSQIFPRPKAGVFAVRQGLPLAENLKRAVLGRPLNYFKPQKLFLSLISTGEKYAIASRGNFSFESKYLWIWKDFIDQNFMKSFNELPVMDAKASSSSSFNSYDKEYESNLNSLSLNNKMRCGGCGSKVSASILSRVISRLQINSRPEVLIGLENADDCAVISIPAGLVAVQTIDHFRNFISDLYIFGKICALHSLNDVYAMGGRPLSALAMVSVHYGKERKMEEDVYQMMSGALQVFQESNTCLVGGHTSESAELALGFSITGVAEMNSLFKKSGMNVGEKLILTKPLGTGILFAANMRRRAKGRWIDNAINNMLISNEKACEIFHASHVNACTDVTGFGLIGHLLEMARASKVEISINIHSIPILDGAVQSSANGFFSSLHSNNESMKEYIRNVNEVCHLAKFPLIFDPQTSGPLLASVPEPNVQACLDALNAASYVEACVIGQVEKISTEDALIRINA